jgi:choice-of-anchor B domain-containing protein
MRTVYVNNFFKSSRVLSRQRIRRPAFEQLEKRCVLAAALFDGVLSDTADTASFSAVPQYTVNHSPYLQPGNAPLVGFSGSTTDQVQVMWQTVPAGIGTSDSFVVDYRQASATSWISAGAISTLNTGVAGRINHFVDITGLSFDTQFEYRVQHLRDGMPVNVYQAVFRTRLPAGATDAFSFVAYGDSAYTPNVNDFRSVQNRINQLDPKFVVLLGDNTYNTGTHLELDARFDPSINPEAADWNSTHIDYFSFGNHDIAHEGGKPTEDNIAVPIPVAGVNAPAEPPAAERDEHNYSFDYGNVHFVTFDTNSLDEPQRLADQLAWVVQDLAASTAKWKVVYGHHPVAGVPDKPESPADNYYQQVVSSLRNAGADLFLAGHSHTYSWTYPLLGQTSGVADFVNDTDKNYAKGAGLVQLVSGLGGVGIRTGDYSQFPFVASGFTSNTTPSAQFGLTQIDVTPTQLIVKYVSASSGAILDEFTIVDSNLPQVSITAVDSDARELGLNQGQFVVTRTGGTSSPLTVPYVVSGTAHHGTDYAALSGSVVIPTGQSSANIFITPIDDANGEVDETVILSLSPNGQFIAAVPTSAQVIIDDNDVAELVFNQAIDTYLHQINPNTNYGSATSLKADLENTGGQVQALIRFSDIFGASSNQIPIYAPQIISATLQLQVTNAGNSLSLHRLRQTWQDSATWNSWTNGIQTNGIEAVATADAVTGSVSVGLLSIDVRTSLQAWLADPSTNLGWVILNSGTDGVDVDSAQGTVKPRLTVVYAPPAGSSLISGTVWNDLDGDGLMEVGEPPLSGRQVYLDMNSNGQLDINESIKTTSSSGQYTFGGLAAGEYIVAVEKLPGWFQSSPVEAIVPAGSPDPNGHRVIKRSQVNISQFNAFGGAPASQFANDITSYVSPLGQEYAIIGLEKGIGFVRITNPATPVIVAVKPGLDEGGGMFTNDSSNNTGEHPTKQGSIWRDMKVFGEYAYAVTESTIGEGLQVFDLTQIDTGIITDITPLIQIGPNTSHTLSVNPATGYLYMSGSSNTNGFSSSGGLVAINVNNPLAPVANPIWEWDDHYIHDVVVKSYTQGPYAGREIAFAFGTHDGVFIIDVTDKSNMFTISNASYPNVRYAHDGTLSEDGKYLFVNDELDEFYGAVSTTTTYVLNVADLNNPFYVTSFTNGLPAIDHNPMVRGGFIFEANYRSGLRIYDISDVHNVIETGYYDTYPADDLSGFNGAWGVDSNLPSGAVIISDIESGLFVFDPKHATIPRGQYLLNLGSNQSVTGIDFGLVFASNMTTLDLAATDANKNEGNTGPTNFTFTVTRTGVISVDTTVSYSVTGGSPNPANANDFVGGVFPTGSITFLPGENSKLISIPVAGDGSLELNEQFVVTLSASGSATIGTATSNGNILNEDASPTVSNVYVAGSNWSPALIDAIDGGGTGAGNGLGYVVTPGQTLPNNGINRIYLQFDKQVVGVTGASAVLFGSTLTDYAGILTVTYDDVRRLGILQLASPIGRDKLRVGVNANAVLDLAGNTLDGSGSGQPGSHFDFRFNVLIGDANGDGSVNGGDLPAFGASFNRSAGNIGYNSFADWDADGSVNGGDLPSFGSNFNQSLPANDPGPLNFYASVSEEPLWQQQAPSPFETDDYFVYYDKEDDEESEDLALSIDEQAFEMEDISDAFPPPF